MPGFAPLVAEPLCAAQPHTLILGSMPSQISLQQRQYYANPRNAFWWIMSGLLQFDVKGPYAHRVSALTKSGFCVWDVLYDCQRPGSLDSNIIIGSEQCNNIYEFLDKHTEIDVIAFNGKAAEKIFMRHCKEVFSLRSTIETAVLPSSSPAHASLSRSEKKEAWRNVLIPSSKLLNTHCHG